jgi:hypothetical protein
VALLTTSITVIGNLIKPLIRAYAHSMRATSTVKAARALGWKDASPTEVLEVLTNLNSAASADQERAPRPLFRTPARDAGAHGTPTKAD